MYVEILGTEATAVVPIYDIMQILTHGIIMVNFLSVVILVSNEK